MTAFSADENSGFSGVSGDSWDKRIASFRKESGHLKNRAKLDTRVELHGTGAFAERLHHWMDTRGKGNHPYLPCEREEGRSHKMEPEAGIERVNAA